MDRIEIPEGLESCQEKPYFLRATGRAFDIRAEHEATEIDLYDEIGFWGVTAKNFRERLKGAGDVKLRINSPGGDVFDGIAIYNDLVDHPGSVNVEISGLAASAASIVAMAGDEIRIAENAFIMIHNAWALVLGDRRDMEHTAGVLAQLDKALARTYADRSKAGIRRVAQMMDDESWLGAKEAVELGFADEKISAEEPKARWDMSAWRNVPKGIAAALRPEEKAEKHTIRDIERLLRDGGVSHGFAKTLAARAFGERDHRDGDRKNGQWDAGVAAHFRTMLETLKSIAV